MMDIIEVDDFNMPVVDLTSEEEQKMDDDLDYALAYCLQTEFEEDSVPDNIPDKQEVLEFDDVSVLDETSDKQSWNAKKAELSKVNKEQDADYLLALQLQTEFSEQNGMNHNLHGISSSNPKPLNQYDESFVLKKKLDADYMLALQLQNELAEENGLHSDPHGFSNGKPQLGNQNVHLMKQKGKKLPSSIIDPEWEVLDPIPDIHSLFLQFNSEFFWGGLEGVEVRWSPRMTLCAGVCCYEGRGGLCSVRLSQPLLKYRPRRDLVETLLHEMIHAYLFVTHNNKDHDAHGPEFLKHMHRINRQTGTTISVYHSFHDEVDLHRKHWWKCSGPCQRRSPFFGLVKRAMNRAPSPRDPWWAQHQATCGGTFTKIKEPESYAQKKNLKRKSEATDGKSGPGDIRKFFAGNSAVGKGNQIHSNAATSIRQPGVSNIHTMSSPDKKADQRGFGIWSVPFSGKGYTLGSSVSGGKTVDSNFRNGPNFLPKLLGNKVTRVPPVGNGFPSKRNSPRPVQRKSPLHNESKNEHPGSSSALASNSKATGGKAESGDIRNYVMGNSAVHKGNQIHSNTTTSIRQPGVSNIHTMSSPDKKADRRGAGILSVPFSGKGYTLGSSVSGGKTVDSNFRNGPNFLPKPLGNKVTRVPPVGNGFPSKGKEINSQNPMQRKSPLYSESKNRHPGSSSTFTSNSKGTAMKFSSASGSKTIVIPKKRKTSETDVMENPRNLLEVPFEGEGFVLGAGPRTSKEKKETKFPISTKVPSASDVEEDPGSRDVLDDSFDAIFPPKAPSNKGPSKSQKTEKPFLKEEAGTSQSKIHFQPASKDKKYYDNIKTENKSVNNPNASLQVTCPVCGSLVRNFAIDAHLDACLKKFS